VAVNSGFSSDRQIVPWTAAGFRADSNGSPVGLSLFDPATARDVAAAHAAGGSIQMAMILLSRMLGHRAGRWANVVAAGFMATVQIGSLAVGTPTSYYLFFSVIEVGTLARIAVLALRWADPGRGRATA
jgi:hypothetical protein